MALEVPLPWERVLWRGHPARPGGDRTQYVLTDFRLLRVTDEDADEVALHDVSDIHCSRTRIDRFLRTQTVVVSTPQRPRALVLHGLRRGAQLAALLDIVSGDAPGTLDREGVESALAWEPQSPRATRFEGAVSVAVVLVALVAVARILHTPVTAAAVPADDPIAPGGQRRPRAEIVAFMEQQVMPWARASLGPLKGGEDKVTCHTCHGADAIERDWKMPAVAALPEPDLRREGWERYGGVLDAQMRNAIYGYLAEADKQTRAGYMREVVMPGMAGVLHRPPYDFTQPYAYNRERSAFGCYHCHRVN